jgi:hypothetical protein
MVKQSAPGLHQTTRSEQGRRNGRDEKPKANDRFAPPALLIPVSYQARAYWLGGGSL